MECRVKSKTKLDFTWYKEGTVVKESARQTISVRQEGDIYVIQLVLKDPSPKEGGQFKCNIKNSSGEINANLTLNIEEVPVFKVQPKIVRVEKRKTVVIECNVTSQMQPTCSWYRERTVVREDRRHVIIIREVTKGEFNIRLEIESATSEDRGSYKLVAKNEKGEATSQEIMVDIPEEKEEEKKEEKKT